MSAPTRVPAATALVLVGLALATGPLVGLSVTAEPGPAPDAGTGSIDATVAGTPDAVRIERGDYGADVAHLEAPPVVLRVASVDGQPTVGYEVAIPGLDYSRTTQWVFDPSLTGRQELRLRRATLPPAPRVRPGRRGRARPRRDRRARGGDRVTAADRTGGPAEGGRDAGGSDPGTGRSLASRTVATGRRRLADGRRVAFRVGRAVLGDRHGAALFCAGLIVYGLCWRLGFLINDSYTVANAFVAVSEGGVAVERAVYGPGLETPGAFRLDGATYGRNYGQLVLSLPFLWAVEAAATVAALRVALASAWGIAVVGFTALIAEPVGRRLEPPGGVDGTAAVTYAGCGLALGGVGLAVRGAPPIAPRWHALIALQLATTVAAALAGVVVYRLLARISGRRVGLAAGVATALSAPIGFWAAFPKRHVPIALCVLVSAYALYRSRAADGTATVRAGGRSVRVRRATAFRALAYVPVGVVAWIHALEGVLLLLALAAADLPTAGRDARSVAAAGGALAVSLLPTGLTNYLIAGDPLQPPRAFVRWGPAGLPGSAAVDVAGAAGLAGLATDGRPDPAAEMWAETGAAAGSRTTRPPATSPPSPRSATPTPPRACWSRSRTRPVRRPLY